MDTNQPFPTDTQPQGQSSKPAQTLGSAGENNSGNSQYPTEGGTHWQTSSAQQVSGSQFKPFQEQQQQYNTLAVVGFITSFIFGITGSALAFAGFLQLRKNNEKGHGLALAGIIIGALHTLFTAAVITFIAVSTMNYVQQTADKVVNSATSGVEKGLEQLGKKLGGLGNDITGLEDGIEGFKQDLNGLKAQEDKLRDLLNKLPRDNPKYAAPENADQYCQQVIDFYLQNTTSFATPKTKNNFDSLTPMYDTAVKLRSLVTDSKLSQLLADGIQAYEKREDAVQTHTKLSKAFTMIAEDLVNCTGIKTLEKLTG